MSENWASSALRDTSDVFQSLHSGLTVGLIATRRVELKTCKRDDPVSIVLASNLDSFDFIPVLQEGPRQEPRFVGLFHASEGRKGGNFEGVVGSCPWFAPLDEEYLIGADASILDFVLEADSHPCRLVVSGSQIMGLATLSDLQKLPVRAALFALITGFEMTMIDYIKTLLSTPEQWMAMLSPKRLEKLRDEISIAQSKDAFVDELLYTQFCDKAQILKHLRLNGESSNALEKKLGQFEKLRNGLAHANEYAASPIQAKNVCILVRDLLVMRQQMREQLVR